MRSSTRWAALAAGLLLAGGPPAPAQRPTPPTPEQLREREQLALADARTTLYGRLADLPLGDAGSLRTWLTSDLDSDRAVRLWARTRPRHGPPRHYADGVCEVDLHAPAAAVRDALLAVLAEAPAAPAGIDADRLRAAAADWPDLWIIGRARPGITVHAGRPTGWENVTREGMELARRAATADATHALLAEAGRLKVTHARRLREFLDSADAVRAAVRTGIERAATVKVVFAPDQVAEAEARLDLRELLRILTRAHQEHYRGDAFAAADFREMVLLAGRSEISAAGLATPPDYAVLRTRMAALELNAPDWAGQTLTETGRYTPGPDEMPDPSAAAEAARLDAIARLHRRVEALVIQGGVTVAGFAGYHQDLKPDIVLFLASAHPAGPARTSPEGTEVTVELPLRRLWEIVQRKMKLEEVEPPAPDGAAGADETGTEEKRP